MNRRLPGEGTPSEYDREVKVAVIRKQQLKNDIKEGHTLHKQQMLPPKAPKVLPAPAQDATLLQTSTKEDADKLK